MKYSANNGELNSVTANKDKGVILFSRLNELNLNECLKNEKTVENSKYTSDLQKGGKVNYIINEKTQALTFIESNYYRTKIYEEDDIIYKKETPLMILENSCLHYGSSLDGRKQAAKRILNMNSKLPVSIKPHGGLFFLPTTSHRNKECVWFSYSHVDDYWEYEDKLAVILNNKQVIFVDISYNQFDLQMKRTSQIIAYFYLQSLT